MIKTYIITALICVYSFSAFAGTTTILFKNDFSTDNVYDWGEQIGGKRRKAKLRVSLLRNDGQGNKALRVQLSEFRGTWAGALCDPFNAEKTGKISVSFLIKAKSGKECKATLAGPRKRWKISKTIKLTRKYQKVKFSGIFDQKAMKFGKRLNLKLDFKNNTDAFIRDVVVSID